MNDDGSNPVARTIETRYTSAMADAHKMCVEARCQHGNRFARESLHKENMLQERYDPDYRSRLLNSNWNKVMRAITRDHLEHDRLSVVIEVSFPSWSSDRYTS
jgi:hypothetical protein